MTWLFVLLLVAGIIVVFQLVKRKQSLSGEGDISQWTHESEVSDTRHETRARRREQRLSHALRKVTPDERLLPKTKPRGPWYQRERLFDAQSARRRFSFTMRSKDRSLSVLVEDPEQLARYGLPLWSSEEQLAQALGISLGQLRHLSMHRVAEKTPHYAVFAIPKRSGGHRLIHAPKRRLKAVQRKLLLLLIDKLPVHDAAHGFRRGRSIRTGAEPHVNRRVVIRLDIKDFFPSVTFARIRGYLVAMGYGYEVATTLACLCSEPERQPVEMGGEIVHVPVGHRMAPQGAPTSPGLANAICHKLDRRLMGLARAHGFQYTRYADDLTFSGDFPERVGNIIACARAIIRSEGFEVNPSKTCVMRRGSLQRVTGVTVNDTLGLSRRERRMLRAAIHRASLGAVDSGEKARLLGHVAYVRMLNEGQAEALGRGMGKVG